MAGGTRHHADDGKDAAAASAATPMQDTPAAAAAAPPATSSKKKASAASRKAAAAAAAGGSSGEATDSTGASSTPVAPASPRKRRADGSLRSAAGNSSSNGSEDAEHKAASRIQAFVRGAKARTAQKHSSLWHTWQELDWKEEAALMNTHGAFEQLKAAVKKADAEGSGGAKKGARSSSPAPGKGKKRRSSLTDHEEAAALGLVWRDKDPLTMVWIEQMMDTFKRNHQLPVALVLKLLKQVTPLLRELPNIVQVPVSARVTVVGDLHGQLDDLLAIFKLQGLPSARNRMIFNGDFVDRGQWSCECILTLLAWKLLLPHDVLLNRGNHEARDINGRDGFEKECLQKYGKRGAEVFDAFSACFAALPLVHIIEQQVFVVHGGLCSRSVTLDEIAAIDRFHEIPPDDSLFCDLLWSDPKPGKGRSESPRGAGLLFGPDVTADFFKRNPPLNLIVRSHECMTKGFKLHHNGTVITVFSASNYTGTVGNDGALIVFERDGGTVLGTAAATAAAASKHPPPSPRGPRAHGAPSSESASSSAAAPSSPAKSLRTRQKHEVHLTVPASVAAAAAASGVVPLKRSIVTFYAAKKEKSASYRITPDSHLQTDIVAKLLHLISDHRLSLINFWSSKAKPHSSGVATITRAEWAAGLKSCLGLNHLPFQELWVQEMLGLPKLGVDGKAKGPIDFMAFLVRFRPVNLLVMRAQRSKSAFGSTSSLEGPSQEMPGEDFASLNPDIAATAFADEEANLASLQQILDLLHQKRFELESLFRFLDVDGDEVISHDEFKEGMRSLQTQLGTKFSEQQVDQLLAYIDHDNDGNISYSEFFASFDLADAQFSNTLDRSKSIRDGRNGGEPMAAPPKRLSSNSSASASAAAASSDNSSDDVDEDAPTPPQSPPRSPLSANDHSHIDDDLSPRHADDDSPPHVHGELNSAADHDDTSESHMHRSTDEDDLQHMETRAHAHQREQEEARMAQEEERAQAEEKGEEALTDEEKEAGRRTKKARAE